MRHHLRHGLYRRFRIGEKGEQRGAVFHEGLESEDYLRHVAESALRTDEELLQAVAGDVLHQLASERQYLSRRQHYLQSQHIAHRDAILDGVAAARVFRDVAADMAGEHAHRVSRIGEPLFGGRGVYLAGDDARFGDGHEVFRVYFYYAVQPLVGDDYASAYGQRSARQPCAAAARGDRYHMPVGKFQYFGYFLSRSRRDDGIRQVTLAGAQRRSLVARTGLQLFLRRPHMRGSGYLRQLRQYFVSYNAVLHHKTPLFRRIIFKNHVYL